MYTALEYQGITETKLIYDPVTDRVKLSFVIRYDLIDLRFGMRARMFHRVPEDD